MSVEQSVVGGGSPNVIGSDASLADLLARALSTPDGGPPTAAAVEALHGRLATTEGLRSGVEAYLDKGETTSLAAVRLLRMDIARGPSEGGLILAETLSQRFEIDERLAELRLRYLFALGRHEALVSDIRGLIGRGVATAALAYQMFLCLSRTEAEATGDLVHRAARRLAEIASRESAGDAELWLGRYHREVENDSVALGHLMAAWRSAPSTDPFREVALREAGDLAVRAGRWGRDAEVLLAARREGALAATPRADLVFGVFAKVAADAPLDAEANIPRTDVYSQLFAGLDTPEVAYDYLVDEVLAARRPYEPADTLLMVGTSLSGGGMERIFAGSYRAVAASGAFERVRMALLTFAPDSPSAFYLPQTGTGSDEIEALDFKGTPEGAAALLPLGLGRRVSHACQIIARERPRIIHAWNDMPGAVAAFAGLLMGCPRIFIHFHHMRAINLTRDRTVMRAFPACYRRLLERPEIELLFVSDAAADDYARWWSVERTAKFRRLLNGFAMADDPIPDRAAARSALGFGPDDLVVGTAFRFHPVKQPLLWIETARAINAALPKTRFVMVGDGALWDEAKVRVAELGLTEIFHFPGQVRNVADYLAAFDLFMLTSRSEGLPNALVEAQLAGVPVVSTDAGGARETFSSGRTGRLVTDATPRGLAAAVIDCLTDAEWLASARVRSAAESHANFGIAPYLERLLALYAETTPTASGR